MTTEYRIEKIRRPLTVMLRDGSRLEGDVFLRPMSRFRARPEDASEMLNDPEPFFALVRNGEAMLVAKDNVSCAETSVAEDEELEIAALGVPVEVTLTDGSTRLGSIFLETRVDRPRLIDFLNAYAPRFLPVVDAQQVLLVNTKTIAHVREVG